jgi:hypothetical protein
MTWRNLFLENLFLYLFLDSLGAPSRFSVSFFSFFFFFFFFFQQSRLMRQFDGISFLVCRNRPIIREEIAVNYMIINLRANEYTCQIVNLTTLRTHDA